MLRILDRQMEALSRDTEGEFVATMAAYLREHYPRWVLALSEEELLRWVAEALHKAVGHGVDTEPEAAQLILLFTVLGLDADERLAWVREVLEDGDLAAIGKVRRLVARSREHEVSGLEHVLVYDELQE